MEDARARYFGAISYRIPVLKAAEDGIEPWLNLSKAAQHLRISPKTLGLTAQAGEINAVHPLPDGPWIFSARHRRTRPVQS